MAKQHSSLTGADLHEPKGADAAGSGTVYLADGVGSGSWQFLPASGVLITDSVGNFTGSDVEAALAELASSQHFIGCHFDDISSPETLLVPIPFGCEVLDISFILAGGITTADAMVTVTRSDGAAMGSQVIAYAGSTEGTRFVMTPSGNGILTDGVHHYVKLVSDGASSAAQKCYVQVHIRKN